MRLAVALFCVIGGAACGPDPRLAPAEQTIRQARIAVRVVQTTGGENGSAATDDLAPEIRRTRHWIRETQHAFELWPTYGSLSFETMVVCLADALRDLRQALAGRDRPVPPDLVQAEAIARSASDLECAERTRR